VLDLDDQRRGVIGSCDVALVVPEVVRGTPRSQATITQHGILGRANCPASVVGAVDHGNQHTIGAEIQCQFDERFLVGANPHHRLGRRVVTGDQGIA